MPPLSRDERCRLGQWRNPAGKVTTIGASLRPAANGKARRLARRLTVRAAAAARRRGRGDPREPIFVRRDRREHVNGFMGQR